MRRSGWVGVKALVAALVLLVLRFLRKRRG
jgi:hypothetical protein